MVRARTPVRVMLADGYSTEDAELALPVPYQDWTGAELRELLEGMLRAICVERAEQYEVFIRWSEQGTALKVTSGQREIESAAMPLGLSAVAAFVGHEEVPPRGEARYEDVMRFKETSADGSTPEA
jgi:hypothetical protein